MTQKILLLLFLTFPLTLFALNQNSSENYVKGIKAYKTKDFKTSYTLFKKIYLLKLSDVNFNFYFGRSAYETGHYETALAAFERVSMMDSTNIYNKLAMARTYSMLQMYEDAEIMYKEVLATPNIPQNMRRNIEISLAQVSKVQKKSFTYTTIMIDFLYDSNINYGSLGSYEFGGNLLGRVDTISDTALQLFANLVNIYDIGNKNGFAIKNSFSVYYKDYKDYNLYDVLFLTYNPSLIYKETHYTAELIAGIDTMQFGKQKYLSSLSLSPRFEFNHSTTLKSLAFAKYQRKKFARQAQHDLDANRYELSYGLQDILTPRSYILGNIIAVAERKLRGTNLYVNFDEAKINLSYANQFHKNFSIDLYGEAKSRNYKDYSSGFNSKRHDIGSSGSVGISMMLNKTVSIRFATTYEYVNSNQDRFSYQKSTTTLGLVKIF